MRALARKSQNKLIDDLYPVSWGMQPGAQVEWRGHCQRCESHLSRAWPLLCRLWKWASLRTRLICSYEPRLVVSDWSKELCGLQDLRFSAPYWLLALLLVPAACSGLLTPLLSLLEDWGFSKNTDHSHWWLWQRLRWCMALMAVLGSKLNLCNLIYWSRAY